jgi:hypothetical protein
MNHTSGRRGRAGGRGRPGDDASFFPSADPSHADDPGAPLRDRVSELVGVALQSRGSNPHLFDTVTLQLAELPGAPGWRAEVESTVAATLAGNLSRLWRNGWQPVDVARVAGRKLERPHTELLLDLMAADRRSYADATVAAPWDAQLRELGTATTWPAGTTYLRARLDSGKEPRITVLARALELAHLMAVLPRLERLIPRPGTARATPVSESPRAAVDERILSRVRALLAKAESTTFEAEAETFTAGAQALMARHSIDQALLAETDPGESIRPDARRVGVDNPYEEPKAVLLDAVATANRCRTVWSRDLGFSTVVGFASDLDSVEVLFTSLLVQAQTALNREGNRKDRYGRSETRSFRRAFLLAFATRIGQRLAEAMTDQTATAAAERDDDRLLPVLAAREQAVDDATTRLFPSVTSHRRSTVSNAEGWYSGLSAADRASLAHGPAVTK